MVLRAEFNQRRVGLECRAEESLTRQETDNEVRSLFKLLPISLARQLLQVCLHALCMGVKTKLLRNGIGIAACIQKSIQGSLGIDDDLAAIRKLNRHVGTQHQIG